jgi:hypothetical protein
MLSMRLLSLAMMLFMLGSMSATKREQQRRWMALHGYSLHGYDEYGQPLRHHFDGYSEIGYHGAGRDGRGVARPAVELDEEAFWNEFEAGRRGGQVAAVRGGLLLQVFRLDQMLSRLRVEERDDDEEEEGEGEGKEEWDGHECEDPQSEHSFSLRR